MSTSLHEEIKSAIISEIVTKKQLHKRNIKSVIDEVKNYYLLNSKIGLQELNEIITELKGNWQEFKEQARLLRKASQPRQFNRYYL